MNNIDLEYINAHSNRETTNYVCVEQNSGNFKTILVRTNMLLEYNKTYSLKGVNFIIAR